MKDKCIHGSTAKSVIGMDGSLLLEDKQCLQVH